MASSILQVLGALLIVAGPLFLIYQAFHGLRDMRRMMRRMPAVDAEIARLTAMNASLRAQIGEFQRECSRLDARIAAWEAWCRKVAGGKK